MASQAGREIMKSEVRGSILASPEKKEKEGISDVHEHLIMMFKNNGKAHSLRKHPGRSDESKAIIAY